MASDDGPQTSKDEGLDEHYVLETSDHELEEETHPKEHHFEEVKVDANIDVETLEESPRVGQVKGLM